MSRQQVTIGTQTINTSIATLGQPLFPSPLCSAHIPNSDTIPLFIDSEHLEEMQGLHPIHMDFEPAGPRKRLFFNPATTKCAIVTCGGLCPGLNDVIRAIVMEAHYKYEVSAICGIRYGLEGFISKYGHEILELTPESVADIFQFGGTVLGSSRGPQNPAEIVDTLEQQQIAILFMLGGDGTMRAMNSVVAEIARRNLKISVIGIPKTIDNDINFISQSFGFETAVFKATESIMSAHIEAVGYKNGIGLVKLMGRESGFIAAQATLALKDVNFLLVPEVPFALRGEGGLLPELANRLEKRKHAVIVAAEGAGQHLACAETTTDISGNRVLADIGDILKHEIKEYLDGIGMPFSIKYIDPSYLIRSIPANANDSVYCGFLGQSAVHAAMAGKTAMVVAKLMDRYVHLPIDLVIRKRRQLNIHSEYWRAVLESTGQTLSTITTPPRLPSA